jgi:hypothetical protein
MADYDFRTLNSTDFEHLVRDILNEELKQNNLKGYFSSYPPGKDKGIDLLDFVGKKGNYNCIVQVKHQPATPYATFLSQLTGSSKSRKSELDKVKALSPERYILATSQSLTLQNRQEILEKMSPYIRSINDILDKEKINHLLTIYPKIQDEHPKLWFSSRTVLERILHNDVYGRSDQMKEDIIRKLQLYVPTDDLKEAEQILKRSQFLVLSGDPGCGKTTLAEILLYKLAGMEFTAYWIDRSVAEVESLLNDDDSKQVFYFDDFLGHTKIEIETLKSNEKGLLYFLKRLKRLPNKYFILTTRTSIITEAAMESERFKISGVYTERQKISVDELSLNQKIQIIENHISVNKVPVDYTLHITDSKNIVTIAGHKSFSPRLIEFVTTNYHYKNINAEDYYQFVLDQLNYPNEVWRHAYEQQLNDYDRFLLTTLFSLGATQRHFLEIAFEERLSYEIKKNNIPRALDTFRSSFKKLMDSFIVINNFYIAANVEFINPSLEDFMNYYLKDNDAEKLRISHSFIYIEQITRKFRNAGSNHILLYGDQEFFDRLLHCQFKTTSRLHEKRSVDSNISFYTSLIIWMFFKNNNGIKSALHFLQKIEWRELVQVDFFHLFGFIRIAHTEQLLKAYVILHFDIIIYRLVEAAPELTYLELIKNLFDDYDLSYSEFIKQKQNYREIKKHIDEHFEIEMENEVAQLLDDATDVPGVGEVREDFFSQIEEQYEIMHIAEVPNMSLFDENNWDIICYKNNFARD